MSKSPKKVMLTPKEQTLRVVRKPKAEKTETIIAVTQQKTVKGNSTKVSEFPNSKRVESSVNSENIPRQPFHNKGKNRKEKSSKR
jgi:hypothetical protein